MASANQNPQTQGQLGVFDAVSIIVGIVIGVSIFELPSGKYGVFANTNDPWMALAVWAVCGILVLIGACATPNWPRIIHAPVEITTI